MKTTEDENEPFSKNDYFFSWMKTIEDENEDVKKFEHMISH